MSWQDIYLMCFVVGLAWTIITLLLGGLHLHLPHLQGGHFHLGHTHIGHGHIGHIHASPGSGAPGPGAHGGGKFAPGARAGGASGGSDWGMTWASGLLTPSAVSVFLAWFGGAGYLFTRESKLAFWLVVGLSIAIGGVGAILIAWVLRQVARQERPMNPADYDMVGVLGTVTSLVRPGGVGEMVFTRDGARRPAAIKTENGHEISPGVEVVVTRFENGIGYVRTWNEFTGAAEAPAAGSNDTGAQT